jgi:hypothetical protein
MNAIDMYPDKRASFTWKKNDLYEIVAESNAVYDEEDIFITSAHISKPIGKKWIQHIQVCMLGKIPEDGFEGRWPINGGVIQRCFAAGTRVMLCLGGFYYPILPHMPKDLPTEYIWDSPWGLRKVSASYDKPTITAVTHLPLDGCSSAMRQLSMITGRGTRYESWQRYVQNGRISEYVYTLREPGYWVPIPVRSGWMMNRYNEANDQAKGRNAVVFGKALLLAGMTGGRDPITGPVAAVAAAIGRCEGSGVPTKDLVLDIAVHQRARHTSLPYHLGQDDMSILRAFDHVKPAVGSLTMVGSGVSMIRNRLADSVAFHQYVFTGQGPSACTLHAYFSLNGARIVRFENWQWMRWKAGLVTGDQLGLFSYVLHHATYDEIADLGSYSGKRKIIPQSVLARVFKWHRSSYPGPADDFYIACNHVALRLSTKIERDNETIHAADDNYVAVIDSIVSCNRKLNYSVHGDVLSGESMATTFD